MCFAEEMADFHGFQTAAETHPAGLLLLWNAVFVNGGFRLG